MIEDVKQEAEVRMQRSIESLRGEFRRLRTGRANVGLLEHLTVEYYGAQVPVNQVATLSVEDARTLTVTPWEKPMVAVVEKAILNSDLGLTPMSAGNVIRVPVPAMTEERRKELVRIVRGEAETGRIAIRNIRRDALGSVKELLREKMITEDDDHRAQDEVQKITDRFVAAIDALLKEKETEIMEF